jgi:hypothetical protein
LIKCSTAETGDCGLSVDGNSSVAGGVKGNRICLSGGVPSADSGTVGVETEDLSSFIARPVMSFDVCVARKVIRVTVQNLSFELDCTQGVNLVEDPAMLFQLQVEIQERPKQEFTVRSQLGRTRYVTCGLVASSTNRTLE